MTISSEGNINTYPGDGADKTFDFTFPILDEAHLEVEVVNDTTGVVTTKTLTTDYTVSGVGNTVDLTDFTSGTVTFGTAPASGETVVIRYGIPVIQGVDLAENDNFPAETMEDSLDKLTMIASEQKEQLERSVMLNAADTTLNDTIVKGVPGANKIIQVDDGGDDLEWVGIADIDAYPVLDEDDMASDSATSIATQQSIKAYVDANAASEEAVEDFVGGMVTGNTETGITVTYEDSDGTLDFVVDDTTVAGDSGSTGITPGDTLTIAGTANEIETSMSGDTLTVGIVDNPTFGGNDSMVPPLGTTGERNGTPTEGMLRGNTTTSNLEYYDGTSWVDLTSGAGGGISDIVDDTTPQLGGQLDVNGQAIGDGTRELLTFTEDASAVNHINIENEATGAGPIISAAGDDTNVDLILDGKGSGDVKTNSSNLDVTGNIVVSGTVDGRDVATDGTKLDGIEASADVTDATNVDAAGAVMNSDTSTASMSFVIDEDNMASDSATKVPTQQSVKAYVDAAGGGISNVVEDTTPQLGGDLDANGNAIQFDDLTGIEDTSGNELLIFDSNASAANYVKVHNSPTGFAAKIDAAGDDTNVDLIIDGKGSGNVFLGNMEFDADQSIGAGQDDYVLTYDHSTGEISLEASAGGGTTEEEVEDWVGGMVTGNTETGITVTYEDSDGTLDFVVSDTTVAGDTGSTGITPGDTLTIAGGTEITTAMSGDTLTINADFTPSSTDTVTNKTINTASNTITVVEADISDLGAYVENVVEDTTPQLGGQLDVNGNAIGDGTRELLTFTEDASAVNHVNIENEATGSGPIISAAGDDTNVDLNINAKGSGNISLGNYTLDADATVGAGQDNYVLTYDHGSGTWSPEAGGAGGGLSDVVDDTTPQLGGDLDVNGNEIVSVGATDITIHSDNNINMILGDAAGTDNVAIKDSTGATKATIDSDGDTTVNALTFLGGGANVTVVNDEDNMASDSATALATQQSIKAYADTKLADVVSDTTPQLGGQLDVNGNAIGDGTRELLTFTEDASAVNHVNIENEATGNGPIISAAGDDTNIDLNISAKGTGDIAIGNFTFDGDQTVGAGQDNYVMTYDNSSGLVSLEAAAGGGGSGGKVLQVVQSTHEGDFSSTSTTYVDTNFNASITPASTSNKVLVTIAGCVARSASTGRAWLTLYRDTTDITLTDTEAFMAMTADNDDELIPFTLTYLDSPSSTSSTEYSLYVKSNTGSNQVKIGVGDVYAIDVPTIVTLMEIDGT